jgi:purine nucleosidase
MNRILLDTDLAMGGSAGADIDDGLALAFALADPDLTVEMVTTVNGNTDVDTATALTLDLLEGLGFREIPVVRGAGRSLHGWQQQPPSEPITLRHPAAPAARPGYAACAIVEEVMAAPGELTIVSIAPLTNVALALSLEPRVAASVREIVVMGGVFLRHTNRAAMPGEFNTFSDPHATAIVLASGAPLRFVGLDVTTQVRMTRQHTEAMRRSGDFGRFAADCADAWIDHLQRQHPGDPTVQGSCALHDPLAVATVSRPDLVTWRDAYVQVETASALTRGVMVADLLTTRNPPTANCRIGVAVDSAAFLSLFVERINSL